MSAPTLGAALYLLLLQFLNRHYDEVYRLCDSCVKDTALDPEEAQARAHACTRHELWAPFGHRVALSTVFYRLDPKSVVHAASIVARQHGGTGGPASLLCLPTCVAHS